jgi:hypothetical protein
VRRSQVSPDRSSDRALPCRRSWVRVPSSASRSSWKSTDSVVPAVNDLELRGKVLVTGVRAGVPSTRLGFVAACETPGGNRGHEKSRKSKNLSPMGVQSSETPAAGSSKFPPAASRAHTEGHVYRRSCACDTNRCLRANRDWRLGARPCRSTAANPRARNRGESATLLRARREHARNAPWGSLETAKRLRGRREPCFERFEEVLGVLVRRFDLQAFSCARSANRIFSNRFSMSLREETDPWWPSM